MFISSLYLLDILSSDYRFFILLTCSSPYSLDDFSKNFGVSSYSGTLSAMTNTAIYRVDNHISDPKEDSGKVGNAWYEQMPSQPQHLLSDMMHALWGSAFDGPCDKKFIRHLHSGQQQTINKHSDCPAHSPAGHPDRTHTF